MTYAQTFTGLPDEGLRFLQNLAQNNTREWFHAHKDDYITYVQVPTLALVVALGARLRRLSSNIVVDTRTNGAGSLMRINRDTRFSDDKTPYKTAISALLWEGTGRKTEHPAFGFRFDATGGALMAGMHGFPRPLLAAYRDAVVEEEQGARLESALAAVRRAGAYTIGGEHYKRVPRGYDADHPRADLLRYNALWAHSPRLSPADLTAPDLVDRCFEHFCNMAPIQRWLVQVDAGRRS